MGSNNSGLKPAATTGSNQNWIAIIEGEISEIRWQQ
jgi:hypothetical protein